LAASSRIRAFLLGFGSPWPLGEIPFGGPFGSIFPHIPNPEFGPGNQQKAVWGHWTRSLLETSFIRNVRTSICRSHSGDITLRQGYGLLGSVPLNSSHTWTPRPAKHTHSWAFTHTFEKGTVILSGKVPHTGHSAAQIVSDNIPVKPLAEKGRRTPLNTRGQKNRGVE